MQIAWDNQILCAFQSKLTQPLYRGRAWEPAMTAAFLKLLRPGMTVVDVGAHCGYYTLMAARRVGQAGRVFAFEPRKRVVEWLKESVETNHYQNVCVVPLALFSKRQRYYIDHQGSSIHDEAQNGDQEILAVRFDDFATQEGLTRLDLVKIDVEGAEYAVLEGMEESLSRWHPTLLIEVHPEKLSSPFNRSTEELFALVRNYGYVLEEIDKYHILAQHPVRGEDELAIPLVERIPSGISIRAGVHKGKRSYYKAALLNTLVYLRPKICLEIGTYYGTTADIFARYFAEYQREGLLITADVQRYRYSPGPRVYQVLVYPHSASVFERHGGVQEENLLPDWRVHLDNSVEANVEILRAELDTLNCHYFDFAFIDGDHAADSLRKDLRIAERLSCPPHFALLDDVFEGSHECSKLFQDELIHEYNHYDFEDWDMFTGTSLLWKG